MKSSLIHLASLCTMLGGALILASPLRADDVARAGRAIAAKSQDAIVNIEVTAKISMSYEGESMTDDAKQEVTGVVIDPSGLVVASLSSVDPVEALAKMSADEEGMKVTAEITGMKILQADGVELPAKIVLRDRDLDLAFIRPLTAPAQPLTAIDLAKSVAPEQLDQVILMYRLGQVANRAVNLTVDRVEAIMVKPRLSYILGIAGNYVENGAPVFALDGNIVGLLLTKQTPGTDDDFYVVLPAAAVADAAEQAPATADATDEE